MSSSYRWSCALGVLLLGACAHGGDNAGGAVETSSAASDPDAGSDAAPSVPAPADDDHDGYPVGVDCDDKDPNVHPKATEICGNGKDDDCNGKIDDGTDTDGDGYFSCAVGTALADCNDSDPATHPHAIETCDGVDNDCNGKIDDVPASVGASLMAPLNPHWAVAGFATITGGAAQLTPSTGSSSGALWWNANYTFDAFDMLATFFIENKLGADGMAFAWVPGNNVTVSGIGAGGFGAMGLGGWAVAIDTYQNETDPAVPFLLVLDATTNTILSRQSIPATVHDGFDHTLRVKLENGSVSVWIDAVAYFNSFPIPNYAPFAGHWGFTGGTGGLAEIHGIRNATIAFPSQGCVK